MLQIVLLSLLGYLCFTSMDFLIQYLLQSHSVFQIGFFNAFATAISVLILAPVLLGKKSLIIRNWKIHLFRGVLIVIMDLSAFYSYGSNSIATAYALILTGPLWSGFFDMVLGKQKKSILIWLAAFFSFGGVLVVLNPGLGVINPTIFFALLSAIVDGFAIYVYRHWGGKESTVSFVLSAAVIATIILLPLSVYYATPYTLTEWGMNFLSGGFFALAAILVLYCYRYKEVLLIGTLQYSQILFAMIINAVVYQILPQPHQLIGSTMVIIGGIILIWSSNKKALVPPAVERV